MGYYDVLYQGSGKYLSSSEGSPMGYGSRASSLFLTLPAQTANQLGEIGSKLNTGAKGIEVQGTFAKILEAIPDQHLEEIRRMSNLTGTKLSMHGPMVEPSGFNQQGGRWEESNREQVERQITNAVERAHILDPKGNIVVTLHSSAELPEMLQREKVDGKEKKTGMYIIDPRTGRVNMIKSEEHFFPESEKEGKIEFDPYRELELTNNRVWTQELGQFGIYSQRGEEALRSVNKFKEDRPVEYEIIKQIENGKISLEDAQKDYPMIDQFLEISRGEDYANFSLRSSYTELKSLFDMAYKSAQEKNDKNTLSKLDAFANEVRKNYKALEANDTTVLNQVVNEGVKVLKEVPNVSVFKPMNEFAIDKSSTTFSNVAYNSYKKFKDSAPILSIENPPSGQGISRAEDLRKLIQESREKFADELVEKEKMSRKKAEEIAEKHIGATWDVGHINMLRKFGYDKKDLISEAGKIAPFVKHIHLSDNFGYEHTELPMGMGNVPLKEEFEKIGKKANEVAKVVETGDWYQHFKTTPLVETFGAFGVPYFSGPAASPYWTTSGRGLGNYFAGYGTMLPDQHFSMYGGGFSALPTELGGQIQRRGSGFSGTPME